MHRTSLASAAFLFAAPVVPLMSAAAQQSDLSLSPFISFLPSTGSSPLAGIALTLTGNTGLGLRASAHMAIENANTSGFGAANTMRPWGADADAILSIGGLMSGAYRRTFVPFVFVGVGTGSRDGADPNILSTNWSYGAGTSIPIGSAIDAFGESRWRMSRFVLPGAPFASAPTTEFRVGLSFHIGGPGSQRGTARRPRDRRIDVTASGLPLPDPDPSPRSASASRIIGTAEEFIGVPYRYGGTSPVSGFDCSGFVQYVFAKHGVRLPRTAREQAQVGMALPPDWRSVSAGDLVMFEENGRIGHVAIYAGNDQIIHSTSSGGGVRYDDLTTRRGRWFVDHMVAARRMTPGTGGLLLDLARGFATGAIEFDPPDHAPKPIP